MADQYRFTTCAKNYLTQFYYILDKMIKGMNCVMPQCCKPENDNQDLTPYRGVFMRSPM